jgi:predicted AAA+ superfamily ATPase
MSTRAISPYILEDLKLNKMVMLSGPRQCGKTTLAKSISRSNDNLAYYNWDVNTHRQLLKNNKLDESKEFWILDELHKYRSWRNWLKGVYDLHNKEHKILVTGSAKLDQYARGGDSLQGRYFHYRLHPFTLSEILNIRQEDFRRSILESPKSKFNTEAQETLLELLKFGGFPEPFTNKSERFSGRWRLSYGQRLIQEDVRTLEQTQELDQMALLYERLPDLICNNLSINNLAKDLETSHQTISKWINIFEKLYANFYVLAYGEAKIKAIKKERKLYLWDWARLDEPGARLENLVALHLLRFIHWAEDVHGEIFDLRYIRDVEGHEIDFLILRKNAPWIAIEVKSSEKPISTGFKYLLNKVKVPFAFQIHLKSDRTTRLADINQSKVYEMPVSNFLLNLP